jgi:hypothetical protein
MTIGCRLPTSHWEELPSHQDDHWTCRQIGNVIRSVNKVASETQVERLSIEDE